MLGHTKEGAGSLGMVTYFHQIFKPYAWRAWRAWRAWSTRAAVETYIIAMLVFYIMY